MVNHQDVYFYPMHLVQEHFSDSSWIPVCSLLALYASNMAPSSVNWDYFVQVMGWELLEASVFITEQSIQSMVGNWSFFLGEAVFYLPLCLLYAHQGKKKKKKLCIIKYCKVSIILLSTNMYNNTDIGMIGNERQIFFHLMTMSGL